MSTQGTADAGQVGTSALLVNIATFSVAHGTP